MLSAACDEVLEALDRLASLEGLLQQRVPEVNLHFDLAELRGAASSLTVFLGMGYTTHPDVAPIMARWHRCGYGR